jgi:Uma2 family endonuclease
MFIHREMTAEEFLAFEAQHPDKRFDFIDGEMVEVSPTPLHGLKQMLLGAALFTYLEEHPLGKTYGVYSEVLHVLDGDKFLPDVCVNILTDADYFTTPPLWVAKIRSDTQSRAAQRRTMDAYLRHGAAMAVLILPGEAVEVFRPDQAVQVLTGEDVLEGGTVLPGFTLSVKRLLS